MNQCVLCQNACRLSLVCLFKAWSRFCVRLDHFAGSSCIAQTLNNIHTDNATDKTLLSVNIAVPTKHKNILYTAYIAWSIRPKKAFAFGWMLGSSWVLPHLWIIKNFCMNLSIAHTVLSRILSKNKTPKENSKTFEQKSLYIALFCCFLI